MLVNNISYFYNNQDGFALNDINIKVKKGSIACLLGHSGCGKSTILKLIAGIENPKSGTIFINDRLVASNKVSIAIEHRNIGLIFQHSALFPHKTVIENIIFAICSSSRKEKYLIASEILKLFNIEKYENMYPHALSGGQQQLVAMSVLAATKKGNFLHAPDVYMEKIAVVPEGVVSLKNSVEENLNNLAKAKGCKVSDLIVTVLKRERHDELIAKIRKAGAKIKLIDDGDIAAIVSLINGNHDMYIGIGGAPEGVLAAAALSSIGGQIEGRLIFDTDQLKERAKNLNITDPEKIYTVKDMAKSESVFIATGVTNGEFVDGVKFGQDICLTNSLIILPGKVIKMVLSHL